MKEETIMKEFVYSYPMKVYLGKVRQERRSRQNLEGLKDCDACIRRRFDQKIGSLRRNEISAHGSREGDRGFFRDHAESYICEGTGRCSSLIPAIS